MPAFRVYDDGRMESALVPHMEQRLDELPAIVVSATEVAATIEDAVIQMDYQSKTPQWRPKFC